MEQEAKKAKSLKSSGGLQFLLSLYNKGKRKRLETDVGNRSHPGRDGGLVCYSQMHDNLNK